MERCITIKTKGKWLPGLLVAIVAALVLGLAPPVLASTITIDGKVNPGEGYTESYSVPFYASSGITYYGTMYQTVTDNSVYQAWVLPLEVNDTTYGDDSTEEPYNWPGKGRKFSQIVGSDTARFQFMDTTGRVILDAYVDNLAKFEMGDGSIQYRSTGVTDGKQYEGSGGVNKVKQGDGSMLVGDASAFRQVATSFDYNLSNGAIDQMIDQVIYEFEIDRAALTGDFSSLMTVAHMSPEKITLTGIGPPTPNGNPGGETPEPGTMLLLGSALGVFAWRRRRKAA